MSQSRALPRLVVLCAFGVSGAAALSYEVVWTRALSMLLGSTTYALSSMLATFMLGLAFGGVVGGRIADRREQLLVWLGAAELAIGALGIASHLVIDLLPALYLPMYRSLHVSASGFFAMQVGLCSLVMLVPTVLMGATFPLFTRAAGGAQQDIGRTIGAAYAANTLGAVAGSLAAGFVLVPAFGLRGATLAAAALNLTVAAALLLLGGGARGRLVLASAIVYVPLVVLTAGAGRAWTLVNFYNAFRFLEGPTYDEIVETDRATLRKVYERDDAGAHVRAFLTLDDMLLLQVGGKMEGTGKADLANAVLLAYLPVAAHPAPQRMLVIGLGAGATLGAGRRVVPEVELAEISSGVLEAVRLHGTKGLLDGIAIYRDDARAVLQRSDARWDVISSEPSYPTDFAVANLYSVEFYRLAAARLRDRGIFCQWMPYYVLTNDDVTMMLKTFASAFPYASLWKVPGSMDLLLLGSGAPFARTPPEILERVAKLDDGRRLDVVLSRAPDQVAEIARRPDVPLNTDDHPRLEFRVARNFRVGELSIIEH